MFKILKISHLNSLQKRSLSLLINNNNNNILERYFLKNPYQNKKIVFRCLSNDGSSIIIDNDNQNSHTSIPNKDENLKQNIKNTVKIDNLTQLKDICNWIVRNNRDITQKHIELAKSLCNTYYESNPMERFHFLCFISDQLSITVEQANKATISFTQILTRNEPYDPALLVDRLQKQIRPSYLDLFRCLSRLDTGVKFLVDLRSDLLTVLSHPNLLTEIKPSSKVNLRLVSTKLADLLALWFNAGFLRLERITWDSPTSILQKISEYEAVHPIKNWLDLKHRLGIYRRCYTYHHNCLQGEPLVILHVALVPTISSSIQEIILQTNVQKDNNNNNKNAHDALSSPKFSNGFGNSTAITTTLNGKIYKLQSMAPSPKYQKQPVEDPKKVDAAVFYSISSTQKGLNGIDLGNQLIKQVAAGLKAEFPSMSQFSSLSPIPNFNEYLLTSIQAIQYNDDTKGFRDIWLKYTNFKQLCGILAVDDEDEFWSRMIQLLRSGDWITDQSLHEAFKIPLMRICAYYLYYEKRRGYALNPVENFHMKNGAVLWRLNWLADISTRGLSNSCGMMVNYRYFLEKHHEYSQIYLNEKRIITGEHFEKWLKDE